MKKTIAICSIILFGNTAIAEETTSPDPNGESTEPSTTAPDGQPVPAEGDEEDTTAAEAASPCDLITCSNHGVCIDQGGTPTCACDEGYMPDTTNGLSCIPTQITSAPAAPPEPVDPERERATAEIYSVLPGYPAHRVYAKYARLISRGRVSGTFRQFVIERFEAQKRGGIVMLGVGGGLAAASVIFLVIGYNTEAFFGDCYVSDYDYEPYCHEDEEIIFTTFGFAFAAGATALLTVGGIKVGKSSSRLKRLKRLDGGAPDEPPPISGWHLTPMIGRDRSVYGLTGGFNF